MVEIKYINNPYRSGRLPGADVFSPKTALLFHGPPRSLRRARTPQIAVGATPSVPSIPARRLELWMKHALKPWEK